MLPQSLSHLWSTLAPALADHLWQSTVFAAAAGLLTFVLRKNSARLRYSLWLAASLKFLIPFSLLVAVGSQFSWLNSAPPPTSGMYVIEMMGQPFSKPLPITPSAIVNPPASGALLHQLPSIVVGLWLCGFLIVLGTWAARWWRISAAIRRSVALTEGREVSTLRRLERDAGMPMQMKLLLSRASLEPGVFGILRPVLMWPHSVSDHLDDSHLEAVMAHELCHVRRRDNLAAVVHMLVEAIFWFHPLVWWVGARLIDERERACDEAVLQLGSERHVYAESILKVCEFCLSSPLTCVSGVTGADLKKRMVHIMTDRILPQLAFSRKLLLWTAACLAIALPIAFGLFNATPSRAEAPLGETPKFATVSIKPASSPDGTVRTKMMLAIKNGDFAATGVTARALIQLAYHIQDTQLSGAPDWLSSEKYDIEATTDRSAADQMQSLSREQRDLVSQRMLQSLLADHFKLVVHQEAKDQPVYDLVIADGGAKLQKASGMGFMHMGRGEISSQGTHLALLSAQLSVRLGQTVVDKTGLTGDYAFALHWTPDAAEETRLHASDFPVLPEKGLGPGEPAPSGPPLMTAIEEQLGLKLQPQTERVPVLVIDHVEQPSQN